MVLLTRAYCLVCIGHLFCEITFTATIAYFFDAGICPVLLTSLKMSVEKLTHCSMDSLKKILSWILGMCVLSIMEPGWLQQMLSVA